MAGILAFAVIAAAEGLPRGGTLAVRTADFLNSIGIGALVVFLKHVKECGGQLVLVGLKGHNLSVLKVVGLTKAFNVCPDIEAGIEAIRQKQPASLAAEI